LRYRNNAWIFFCFIRFFICICYVPKQDLLILVLYINKWNYNTHQSRILPTNGEIRVTLASAQATAWAKENNNVRLQWIPYFSSNSLKMLPMIINRTRLLIEYKINILIWFLIYFAAWMPSQVDASLIKMRSLLTPSPSYRAINLFAFSILASLLKDNLASTSVETLPGIIFKISLPNRTHVMSRAASTCSAKVLEKKSLH